MTSQPTGATWTWPEPDTGPPQPLLPSIPPPNLLAVDLRGILDDLGDKPERMTQREALVYQRLLRLTEHVERVSADPAETTAGLDPEQEMRARALDVAASWLAYLDQESGLWELADQAAAYIRDGSRP